MGKPKMIGMFKPYTPNSKADSRRKKPFTGERLLSPIKRKDKKYED